MKSFDYSLQELKDFLKLLHAQTHTVFLSYGIKQFWAIINNDPKIKEFIDVLLIDEDLQKTIEESFQKKGSGNYPGVINILGAAKSAEHYLSLCSNVIKTICLNNCTGNLVYLFINGHHSSIYNADKDKKNFIETFIEPLVLYVERKINLLENKVYVLKRYKLYCQNYEADYVRSQDELTLTKNHLTKFLFKEGINHIFSETNVSSGRIDVFSEKEAIIIEGKIYDDNKKSIYQAIHQAKTRIEELKADTNFNDAYVVIYNKSKEYISIQDQDGDITGVPFWLLNNKRIFILVIDLEESILKSKRTDNITELPIVKAEYINSQLP